MIKTGHFPLRDPSFLGGIRYLTDICFLQDDSKKQGSSVDYHPKQCAIMMEINPNHHLVTI